MHTYINDIQQTYTSSTFFCTNYLKKLSVYYFDVKINIQEKVQICISKRHSAHTHTH